MTARVCTLPHKEIEEGVICAHLHAIDRWFSVTRGYRCADQGDNC
jgi:hypothetical protein